MGPPSPPRLRGYGAARFALRSVEARAGIESRITAHGPSCVEGAKHRNKPDN